MTTNGSQIVQALEHVWDEIRKRHPEVPPAVIVTGSGAKSIGLVLGHHAAGRWTDGKDSITEIFLSGERLGDGPQGVLSTLLHEAAHGVNHTRGVQDCSRGGRYHNKAFIATAKELGLKTTDTPHPSIGFSFTECPDETFKEYKDALKPLAKALRIGRGTGAGIGAGFKVKAAPKLGPDGKPLPKTSGSLLKVVCDCEEPRTMRVSRKVLDGGPIVCGNCDANFHEEDPS